MSIKIVYEFDPEAINPDNYIDFSTYITTNDPNYRIIIPQLAPFYAKDLVITHSSGAVLTLGVDYELGGRISELDSASLVTALPLYEFIVLINRHLVGKFNIKMRIPGGGFCAVSSEVMTYLANHLTDKLVTTYNSLTDIPVTLPPAPHEANWCTIVNTADLAATLDELANGAVNAALAKVSTNVAGLLARLDQIDQTLDSSGFAAHIAEIANVHAVTCAQTQSLRADAYAVNAARAFGYSLAELAEYINANAITPEIMNGYLKLVGDQTFSNRLALSTNAVVVKSSGVTAELSLANNSVKLTCAGTAHLRGGDGVVIKSGANTLRIHPSNTTNVDNITYNGDIVIHLGNLKKHLANVSFDTLYVVVGSTETAVLSGDGSTADPVTVLVTDPAATTTVSGVAKIATVESDSQSTAIAVSAVQSALSGLLSAVPTTRKINNHPLSSNVTLTKGDINLSLVDNTADLDKPISTEQGQLLSYYSPVIHTHVSADIVLPDPALDQSLATLQTDPSLKGTAAPTAFSALRTTIENAASDVSKYIQRSELPTKFWGPVPTVSSDGGVVNIGSSTYWLAGVKHTLAATTLPLPDVWGKWYLIVSPTEYTLSAVPNSTADQLVVGTIKMFNGVLTADVSDTVSFGDWAELAQHIADPTAHGLDSVTKTTLSVTNVLGVAPSAGGSTVSPNAMVYDWTAVTNTAANWQLAGSVVKCGVGGKYTTGISPECELWLYADVASYIGTAKLIVGLDASGAPVTVSLPATKALRAAVLYDDSDVVVSITAADGSNTSASVSVVTPAFGLHVFSGEMHARAVASSTPVRYGTAAVVSELAAAGAGVIVTAGVCAVGESAIPLPKNCAKVIVILSPKNQSDVNGITAIDSRFVTVSEALVVNRSDTSVESNYLCIGFVQAN